MAITYVGGVVAGRTGNSNATVVVPLNSGLTGGSNSGVSAGDLVVVTVCTGSAARSSVVAVTAPATYQNLTAQRTTATTYDTNVQVSYKFMPSTPDSEVTIPAQGNVADGQAYAVQVFRGVDPTTPLDVTPTYATGSGTNSNPNPAEITPTTAGAWIVVTGGGAAATGANFTASYLTNFLTASGADTNDATVGAGYYTAWTSGAYDPAAFGGGSTNTANSWGATTIALRPAATQTLTPSLFSNSNTFYTANLVQIAPTTNLTATLFTNDNSFYTQTVTAGVVVLSPSLITNTQTFYTADLQQSSVTINLSPSLYTNTNTLYTPSISVGVVSLSPNLVTSTNTFYSTSVSVEAVELQPNLFTENNQFYSVNLTKGTVNLSPSLFINTNEFFGVGISADNQVISPSLFENTNTFYSVGVTQGAVNLVVNSIYENVNTFFTSLILPFGYPNPSEVKLGVVYGPTGTEYTGSLKEADKMDITTGRMFKIINKKIGMLL